MITIATGFERAAAPHRSYRANGTRRVLRMIMAMLDRLVPPSDGNGDAELPDAWFKYPPV